MKPTLEKKPNDYELQQLKVDFANGKPLSADQLNFLSRHEKALSHYGFDPALKYYLKSSYRKAADHHSFLMHHENFNAQAAKELRKRLQMLLTDKGQRIKLHISPRQFLELKNTAVPSLIFYHGNQFLTGAPFYLGGIPHVVYFQWGNYFGIAKYVMLAEEKALNSNVLIYFENMYERNLEECVQQATKELRHELLPVQQLAHTHHLEKQTPQENYRPSVFQTPKLTLSLGNEKREDK